MLTERALQLINAELDGELAAGEREELDAILETSADARAMRAEMLKLGNLLDAAPELEPPAELSARILDQLAGPAKQPRFSLAGLFSSFQPATAGLGFAAGLLAAVVVYEVAPVSAPGHDTASMVGTLVANRQGSPSTRLDGMTFNRPDLTGEVVLRDGAGTLMLEFDVESESRIQVEVALDAAGLTFGGIALTGDTAGETSTYEVSGGALRVVNQGRQAFTVFLPKPANDSAGSREIRIGLTSGGENIYSGVLRG